MPVTWNDHVELDCITSPRRNTSLFVSVGVPDIRCCAGSWYQDTSSGKSTKVFESHPHFLGRLFGSWKYQNKDQPVLTLRSCFQHILAHRWWPLDRSSCGSLSCGGWWRGPGSQRILWKTSCCEGFPVWEGLSSPLTAFERGWETPWANFKMV